VRYVMANFAAAGLGRASGGCAVVADLVTILSDYR
jgi:hypothetical protein